MRTVGLVVLWTALAVLAVVGTVLRVRAMTRLAEVQRQKPMRERLKLAVPVALLGVVVLVIYMVNEF